MVSQKRVIPGSILTRLKERIMAKKEEEGLSIIDKDCAVEGTLNVQGKLIVAGILKGAVTGNTVVTAEGSRVDAQAKVREMIIGGECQGDITVYENLKILSTGIFSGQITCKNISLEPGGKLDGRVKLLDSTDGFSSNNASAAQPAKPASPEVGGDKTETDSSKPA